MEDLVIRVMKPQDAYAVSIIENEVFSRPWSEKSFMDACVNKDNVYLVCESEGVIVGYCGFWGSFLEADITNVCVAALFRRRGVAELMINRLIDSGKEKGIKTFFLEVRESNAAAIALYEKLCFKRIGERKNFYDRPVENAIVMSKIIDDYEEIDV